MVTVTDETARAFRSRSPAALIAAPLATSTVASARAKTAAAATPEGSEKTPSFPIAVLSAFSAALRASATTWKPSLIVCGMRSRWAAIRASAVKNPIPAGSTWKRSLTTSPSEAASAVVAVAETSTFAPVRSADGPSTTEALGPSRWKKSKLVLPVLLAINFVSPPVNPPVACATMAASRPSEIVPAESSTVPELPMDGSARWSVPEMTRTETVTPGSSAISSACALIVVSPPPPKSPGPAKTSLPGEVIDSSPEPVVSPKSSPSTTTRARAVTEATVWRPLLRLKPLVMISWPAAKPSATKSPVVRVKALPIRSTARVVRPVVAEVTVICTESGVASPLPVSEASTVVPV